jgi:Tuberculosis necrotizing toxin
MLETRLGARRTIDMFLRRFIASATTGMLLLVAGITSAPSLASATTNAAVVPVTACSNAYLDGDSRLGPEQLPNVGELGLVVRGYQPLAGLSAEQFIATYWDPTANGGSGGWRYPPDNGFLIANGHPVEYQIPLGVGQDLDRFGSLFGSFLAPEGTAYAQRALPPMSLDNFDPMFTCNYHEYQVTKSFLVESGPIAPGFGQPGLGRQYQLVGSLVPGAPAMLNVSWLVSNGYLTAID